MAIFKIRGLNDGTKGKRFEVFGVKGLYRIRKVKNRTGFDVKDSFAAIHFRKVSFYVESGLPHWLYSFAG
jgi:hypothetical protein